MRFKIVRRHESELEGGTVEELFDADMVVVTPAGALVALDAKGQTVLAFASGVWLLLKELIE